MSELGEAPLLEVVAVSKRFGSLIALSKVSFQANAGEILGLIGPNGAGKTTMIGILSGGMAASEGEVRLAGRKIDGLRPHKTAQVGVARTFQLVEPFRGMDVRDCVMVGALFGSQAGRSTAVRSARAVADEVLRRVGLQHKADLPSESLNVPERKRLEIARALAARPRLLLLDEVMAGLNATEVNQTIGLLREVRAAGVTIILIEHVVQAVRNLADRVVVLNHGVKIAEGPTQDVLADEQVVALYLGRPRDDGRRCRPESS